MFILPQFKMSFIFNIFVSYEQGGIAPSVPPGYALDKLYSILHIFTCFVIDIILWLFLFPLTHIKYILLILINSSPSSSGTRHYCNWPTFALLCYRHEPVNVIYFCCWRKILRHVCHINHANWTRNQWRS